MTLSIHALFKRGILKYFYSWCPAMKTIYHLIVLYRRSLSVNHLIRKCMVWIDMPVATERFLSSDRCMKSSGRVHPIRAYCIRRNHLQPLLLVIDVVGRENNRCLFFIQVWDKGGRGRERRGFVWQNAS